MPRHRQTINEIIYLRQVGSTGVSGARKSVSTLYPRGVKNNPVARPRHANVLRITARDLSDYFAMLTIARP
jgi:hypothetical protein